MRRDVAFALFGMVALWLVSFLPREAGTFATAMVVGIGGAAGTLAAGPRDILALAVGAFLGTLASGLTQSLGSGGPMREGVLTGSIVVAVIVAVAGYVAFVVTKARRLPPAR
jgi:hypothetical protein